MPARNQVIVRLLGYAADPRQGLQARRSFLAAAIRYQRMTDAEYLIEANKPYTGAN